jgi:hypothetical protein
MNDHRTPTVGSGRPTEEKGSDSSGFWRYWNTLPGLIQALTPLILGLVAGGAAGTAIGQHSSAPAPQPTVTVTAPRPTVTVTASAPPGGGGGPSASPPASPGTNLYSQEPVGITFDGINFDLKPATTSADSPTNISFGENSLENSWSGTTVLVSQWTDAGQPTQAQCANWVLTHPTHVVNNVAEGTQICIRTVQGRIGRLTVTSISPDQNTLNVMAVIWN